MLDVEMMMYTATAHSSPGYRIARELLANEQHICSCQALVRVVGLLILDDTFQNTAVRTRIGAKEVMLRENKAPNIAPITIWGLTAHLVNLGML